ncbi:MAG: hypothetical protein AAF938_08725 [Myxococcota bacterium]
MQTRLLFALPALLAGCGGSSTPVAVAEPTTVAANLRGSATTAQAAGTQALFTISVRLDRWEEILRQSPIDVPPESQGYSLLNEALAEATRETRNGPAPTIESLTALDMARPVFVRFAEVNDSLTDALALLRGEGQLQVRHVIALPAADMELLAEQVRPFFSGCTATNERAFYCMQDASVDLVPRGGWLFAIIRHDESGSYTPAPSDLGLLSEDVSALTQWALVVEGAAGAIVRPRPIRGLGVQWGAWSALHALENADPSAAESMRMVAMGELVGAYLRSSPYTREIDRFALRLEGERSLAAVGDLSERGRQLWQGASTVSAPSGSSNPSLGGGVRTSVDLEALIRRVGMPFGFNDFDPPSNAMHAFQECGAACVGNAVFALLGMSHMALEASGGTVPPELPIQYDPSLPEGRIDVTVSFFSEIYLRSQISAGRWMVGVSNDEGTADAALASVASAPASTPSPMGDEASLGCLERLGRTVSMAFQMQANAATPPPIEQWRAQVDPAAACATAPDHAADRDAYLAAFAMFSTLVATP